MVYSGPVVQQTLSEKDRRIIAVPRQNALVDKIVTYPPKPFQFGYELEDGHGMSQYRSEASDGNGNVKGSYGYIGPDGLYRRVDYKVDSNGYTAVVKTNEPGTANQNVADALFIVEPPPPAVIAQGLGINEISPRDNKS